MLKKKIANYATDLLVDEQGYINCVDWMCCLEQALEMAIVSAAKGDEIADIRLLSLNDSSTLLLLKQCGERYGLPTPDYVDSKGSLHSATELLKRNGLSLSARAFNRIALSCGYLQTKTRPSRKGSKEYRNLTEKVLRYGENQVNPNNPKETQPLYYDTTFMELCKELEIA